MTNEILSEQKNHILCLQLNRPNALNAINHNMVAQLSNSLDYAKKNDDISMVILEGSGRAFCAGGDVLGAYHAKQQGSDFVDFFSAEYAYNLKLANFNKPYLSFYNGIVMGGGVGNSIYGKYRIASENTIWAMPEAAIGFFTDVGASYFTQRLSLPLALFICLTGIRLQAADCLDFGFITHYIKACDMEQVKFDLITNSRYEALENYKSTPEKRTLEKEQIALIEEWFNATSFTDILKNLEKQNCNFAEDILKMFASYSPLSLLVIFKHIIESRTKTLAQCLAQDRIVMYNMLHSPDFYEGVRALLVDKDKQPKWEFENIYDISQAKVESYFHSAY